MPKTSDPKGKPLAARGREGFSGSQNTNGGDIKSAADSSPLQFRQRATAVIVRLAEAYPRCFFVWEQRRRPLKIGIHCDLLAATIAFSPGELNVGLKYYVGALGYLEAVLDGAERIDLNGDPAGSVTAEQAEYAKQRAEKMKATAKARRKARAKEKAKAKAGDPKRLSMADLREAARLRKQRGSEVA
jgi:ProP effector